MERFKRAFERFNRAFKRYEEVIINPLLPNVFREEFIVEIITKRFEFVFEAMWKCIKEFLRERGIECYSPKSCFMELIKEGVIPEELEEVLGNLIKIRNQLVHIYDEEMAKDMAEQIRKQSIYETIKIILEKMAQEQYER